MLSKHGEHPFQREQCCRIRIHPPSPLHSTVKWWGQGEFAINSGRQRCAQHYSAQLPYTLVVCPRGQWVQLQKVRIKQTLRCNLHWAHICTWWFAEDTDVDGVDQMNSHQRIGAAHTCLRMAIMCDSLFRLSIAQANATGGVEVRCEYFSSSCACVASLIGIDGTRRVSVNRRIKGTSEDCHCPPNSSFSNAP